VNAHLFQPGLPPRTIVIGRMRKDAKLYAPLPPTPPTARGRRRQYGPPLPTPAEILKDPADPWQTVQAWVAGEVRSIQAKVIPLVYWRKAGSRCPLQLVILKPAGYRLRKGSALLYREPAFLICTEPQLELPLLVQAYLYRWEIECNHRDEKSLLGIAQGQVRNIGAVTRLPALQVASYSLLLLASLLSGGFYRGDAYLPPPKWRKQPARPSLLDMLNLLREQCFASATAAPAQNFYPFAFPPPAFAKSSKMPPLAEILCTHAA